MMKDRLVEVYVAEGSSDGGTWYVADIYVDASLPENEAIEEALTRAQTALDQLDIEAAFTGLYAYWNDEMMEAIWDEVSEVHDVDWID